MRAAITLRDLLQQDEAGDDRHSEEAHDTGTTKPLSQPRATTPSFLWPEILPAGIGTSKVAWIFATGCEVEVSMLLGKLRLPLIACAFAATITFGCGGNGDDNTDSGETGGSTSMTPEATRNDMATGGSATEPTQPPDNSSTGNVPANTARVIIGDRTYEFEMLICVSIGGAIGGPGRAADGSDVSLELDIPPEDWETSSEDWGPPYIRVDDDANELDWRAGGDTSETFPTIDASQSVVESYTTQGGSSQGTAIFADTNAAFDGNFEVATGSFAVNCGN